MVSIGLMKITFLIYSEYCCCIHPVHAVKADYQIIEIWLETGKLKEKPTGIGKVHSIYKQHHPLLCLVKRS
jgi:hypothetical protein